MRSVASVNGAAWKREVLQSDKLTVVDFWHEGCLWCRKLEPILEEVSEEYGKKAKFVSLNVLESTRNQQIALDYGIMAVPTLGFFCDGRPVVIAVGFKAKETLKLLVDDVLAKHRECIEKSTELKIR